MSTSDRLPLLAIDPGTNESAWVIWDGHVVAEHAIEKNTVVLERLRTATFDRCRSLAIEMIASYGMAVGAEVFETCVWIGRFIEQWEMGTGPRPWRKVYRREVKMELCGSARAKDPNIRRALLDRVGPQGNKKSPGPTYGISKDGWAALGVAIVAAAYADGKKP